ncbi:hypothetical protein LTR66_017019, partial [Elasticomyces elasticus]
SSLHQLRDQVFLTFCPPPATRLQAQAIQRGTHRPDNSGSPRDDITKGLEGVFGSAVNDGSNNNLGETGSNSGSGNAAGNGNSAGNNNGANGSNDGANGSANQAGNNIGNTNFGSFNGGR